MRKIFLALVLTSAVASHASAARRFAFDSFTHSPDGKTTATTKPGSFLSNPASALKNAPAKTAEKFLVAMKKYVGRDFQAIPEVLCPSIEQLVLDPKNIRSMSDSLANLAIRYDRDFNFVVPGPGLRIPMPERVDGDAHELTEKQLRDRAQRDALAPINNGFHLQNLPRMIGLLEKVDIDTTIKENALKLVGTSVLTLLRGILEELINDTGAVRNLQSSDFGIFLPPVAAPAADVGDLMADLGLNLEVSQEKKFNNFIRAMTARVDAAGEDDDETQMHFDDEQIEILKSMGKNFYIRAAKDEQLGKDLARTHADLIRLISDAFLSNDQLEVPVAQLDTLVASMRIVRDVIEKEK